MKKIFLLSTIILLAACSTGSKLLTDEVNKIGSADNISDSVLHSLQQKNDIVIAYITENYAWGRNISYSVICKNKDAWSGYRYNKKNMINDMGYTLSAVTVNTAACDSLLNYITTNKVWEIKGETGEEGSRCPNANQNCNIADAASNSLWLITKEKFIAPSYYAPFFFEECCPGNKDRHLFLMTGMKVMSIVKGGQSGGETKMEY